MAIPIAIGIKILAMRADVSRMYYFSNGQMDCYLLQ